MRPDATLPGHRTFTIQTETSSECTCGPGATVFGARPGGLLELVVDGGAWALDAVSCLMLTAPVAINVSIREILPGSWWRRPAAMPADLGLARRLWWRGDDPIERWPRVTKLPAAEIAAGAGTAFRTALARVPVARPVRKADLFLRLLTARGHLLGRSLESFGLATLAPLASLSPTHFLRLHDATFGTTPYAAFQAYRLALAADLMAHTALPTADVAVVAGFDNRCSFSRAFTRAHGRPPGRYRSARRLAARTRNGSALASGPTLLASTAGGDHG